MLAITPGNPSINIRWPFSGLMSKMMFQREPMTDQHDQQISFHDNLLFENLSLSAS
jgi:hypothetical protein